MRARVRRTVLATSLAVLALATIDLVAASNVAAGLSEKGNVSVPTWLYALTGGAVIGASGLLSMLVTDRELVEELHGARRAVSRPRGLQLIGRVTGGVLGLVGLVAILFVGLFGPDVGQANLAVLLVFVGGRAGLTIVAYAVGNPWPAIDPWRRLAAPLPTGVLEYPADWQQWPAVVGMGALLWLELAMPVLEDPTLLAALVVCYTIYTLAGAVLFGREPWFERADPISVWYRFYGSVGPLQRSSSDVELRPHGSKLRSNGVVEHPSDVAFVLLLVWELTFSGLVTTPAGDGLLQTLGAAGIPAQIVYLAGLALGVALLGGAYFLATRRCRQRAQTYLSTNYLGMHFASPLLAIAAGYHFAHYGGLVIQQLPAVAAIALDPLGAVDASLLVLPSWFGHVEALAILVGHVLAVWIAHGIAVSTFPGRLHAIRSQYPYILLMAALTMVSLWTLSQPLP